MEFTTEELKVCLKVLQEISEDPSVMNKNERFKGLVAKIHRQAKKNNGRNLRRQQKADDRKIKSSTTMVQARQTGTSAITANDTATQTIGSLQRTSLCYICKQPFTEVHFFYHSLCPACAPFNYQKRQQRTNLKGRVALITGGRIKIGWQTALRLLRDGASVILTTRFPHDCAERFSKEEDFKQWCKRLQIYALDLRVLPAVEAFTEYLLNHETTLDIIINNAAQTIKRPLAFYQHLLEKEQQPVHLLPAEVQNLLPANSPRLSPPIDDPVNFQKLLTNHSDYFPKHLFDSDGQQLDLRPVNSWSMRIDEVSTVEMLEVQLVNAIAPFILNSRLKSLLKNSRFERRFIINVSAMEGQFSRLNKTSFHPHTNMAKAALNMMTRTSAADYAAEGIFMNSVDTGWITDENPYPKSTRLREENHFYTPLDAIDGMARIYDPIVQGIEEKAEPLYGHFLKDYLPHPW
jgi:NAD(P)-dependent dehydrogenase (short-subunit alcohol dehydrogenase family)